MIDPAWLHESALLIPLTGLFGLLVGSFLNVVILRLPRRLEHDWRSQARELLGDVAINEPLSEAPPPDLVFTGSHCLHCKHPLSPLDNIPLLSWLALRGRCRYCKAQISWQYPIVGAAVGYLSLWSVFWLFKLLTGKEGMGYGDFKLLAALGAWMGAMSLLPTILLSSLIGAIVGGISLALQGRDRGTPIPFGPFIAAAGWAWFVFGDHLGTLYASLFGLQ
jgi:prepilin signal peptidase PulO-like enzyme (type II secretory pathway)